MTTIPDPLSPRVDRWHAPPAEAEPFRIEWVNAKLNLGWPPFRVATSYLGNDGEFTAELFDWLCSQDCSYEDIARFARFRGVERGDLLRATVDASDRVFLLKAFISGKPLREKPPRGAPADEVAIYLDEVVAGDLWETESERVTFQRLCEENGWFWPQVSRALRKRRIAAIGLLDDSESVGLTKRGIAIYPRRFPDPQPLCPFRKRYYHLGHLTDKQYDAPCNSPSCEKCGPDLADRLLSQVESRIKNLEIVHVAQTEWDPSLTERMGQRRKSKAMNTFTHRDVYDIVTIIADKPIGGTSEPKRSEPMTPAEVSRFLTEDVMWVPGHVSASWSEGWKPKSHDDLSNHVSLAGLSEEKIEEFKRQAAVLGKVLYDMRPGIDPLPPEKWSEFRDRLIALRDTLKSK